MGIPSNIIKAIAALYINNIHFMKGGSGTRYAFVALAGVRQGCPLSSTFFVLVTDCIMRALSSVVKYRDMIRGYADDLAVLLENIWVSAPHICRIFETVAQISQLVLNGKKCVVVPLWFFSECAVETTKCGPQAARGPFYEWYPNHTRPCHDHPYEYTVAAI